MLLQPDDSAARHLGDHTSGYFRSEETTRSFLLDVSMGKTSSRDAEQSPFRRVLGHSKRICSPGLVASFLAGFILGVLFCYSMIQKSVDTDEEYFLRVTLDNSNTTTYYISQSVNVRHGDDKFAPAKKPFPRVSFLEGETRIDDRVQAPLPMNEEDDGFISRGVYWGSRVERSLPRGFDPVSHRSWVDYVDADSVVKLETGCGRMQNRMATLGGGKKACVRYRQNTDQIQGELFSFYLAQTLGLPNLAPSTVALVNLTERLWRGVVGDASAAKWNSNRPVVLTEFVPELEAARIPCEFKTSDGRLNASHISKMSRSEAEPLVIERGVELAQWSDLIVFDYLTANLDRMVNNMYNHQWNPNMMEAPAHNLARKSDSGLLVFLDNESGLLHGYRLLNKYEPYHARLLAGVCIFRKRTIDAVMALHESGAAGRELNRRWAEAVSGEPALKEALPPLPPHTQAVLQERLAALVAHVRRCREIANSPKNPK